MNCCNDYGRCTHGPGCPAGPAPAANRRSCDALGLCQAHEPACPGCTTRPAQAQADEPLTRVDDVLQSVALVMLLALSAAVLGVASGIVWALHGSEIRELVWSAITTLGRP